MKTYEFTDKQAQQIEKSIEHTHTTVDQDLRWGEYDHNGPVKEEAIDVVGTCEDVLKKVKK